MGRPTNNREFGIGSGKIACLADVGSGNVVSHIVSQRSNSTYVVAETATPANTLSCSLVQGVPAAPGEMQVTVTIENAQATAQATVTFTDNAGAIDAITSFDGGYGYWTAGTGVVVAGGGGDGTVDYTVSNGSINSMVINAGGSGYTGSTQNIADAPDANPPVQSARIINARTVKTFEGDIFMWPAVGGAGTPEVRGEADLDTQA